MDDCPWIDWPSRGCVLYRKTLSEIYGQIIRDGVSESNRPLFSAPSIMLISIAARLMEEGGVPFWFILGFSKPPRRRPDVPSAFGRPCITHQTWRNYCRFNNAHFWLSMPANPCLPFLLILRAIHSSIHPLVYSSTHTHTHTHPPTRIVDEEGEGDDDEYFRSRARCTRYTRCI